VSSFCIISGDGLMKIYGMHPNYFPNEKVFWPPGNGKRPGSYCLASDFEF